jgi:quercetin dioxygenase-like cupin family protein
LRWKVTPIFERKTIMWFNFFSIALSIVALQAVAVVAAETSVPAAQQITRAGSQASAVRPAANFTGQVRVDMVWPSDDGINASGALVTFEPGARSAWHRHPAGQRLVVMSGLGLTQEWGKAVQEIRPGDVVWCPAGVKHWHGASPKTAMSHLAVTGTANGKNVEWLENVSDEQYNNR